MPTPSNITLRVTRNAGAPETGVVIAAYSDSCALSLADPTGVTTCRYEIFDYPSGFTVPGGWSTSTSGIYYYVAPGGGPAPAFSLPAADLWGKFPLRATVDGGIRSDLIDERTGLKIPSPSGQEDIAYLEGGQFDPQRHWIGPLKQLIRRMETGGTGNLGLVYAISKGIFLP